MRIVTRVILFVAALAGIYSLALLIVLGWPATGWIVLVLAVALVGRRGGAYQTQLGSARWATPKEMKKAGMLSGKPGLIIGKTKSSFGRDRFITLPNAVHTAFFSPTGGGKGVSGIIPFLLTCPDPCIVVDIKGGENARITAEYRRKHLGHRVVLVDAYKIVTGTPDTLNPLDSLDETSPAILDDIRDISKSLVARTGKEHERHFDDCAEVDITAYMATVVAYGSKELGTRSIQKMREIKNDPEQSQAAIELMRRSDIWGGKLKELGGHLMHFKDREKASIDSTVARFLSFATTPIISDSIRTSSFDPFGIPKGKMTVYLILPAERIDANIGWIRMNLATLLRACMQRGDGKNKVHVIIDEAAAIGQMESITAILNMGRGSGLRLQLFYQSVAQVEKSFPEQSQTLHANVTSIYMGVNDYGSAEAVSKRLGPATIKVVSGGTNRGTSRGMTFGRERSSNKGSSEGSSSNWNLQSRNLLNADEVIALRSRTAVIFTPGMRPILTTMLRYHEENLCPGSFRRLIGDLFNLLKASALCALALLLAAGLTKVMGTKARPPVPAYQPTIFGDR